LWIPIKKVHHGTHTAIYQGELLAEQLEELRMNAVELSRQLLPTFARGAAEHRIKDDFCGLIKWGGSAKLRKVERIDN
jgi:hypothetical protein